VTRVYRDDLVTFQGRRPHGFGGGWTHRLRHSGTAGDASAGVESRREAARMISMPTGRSFQKTFVYDNGFKEQWEMFIRHVCEDAPYKYTLLEGAKGVQLAVAQCRAGANGAGSTSLRSGYE